jgi:hypothetical protein
MENFFHLNDSIDLEDDVLILEENSHPMHGIFDEVQEEYIFHLNIFL